LADASWPRANVSKAYCSNAYEAKEIHSILNKNTIILPKINCRIQRHIVEKEMKKYASKNGVQQNKWADYD